MTYNRSVYTAKVTSGKTVNLVRCHQLRNFESIHSESNEVTINQLTVITFANPQIQPWLELNNQLTKCSLLKISTHYTGNSSF